MFRDIKTNKTVELEQSMLLCSILIFKL